MDSARFVGLPWRDHGRELDGSDCWGLFKLVFEAGTGIEIASFADDYSSSADKREIAAIVDGEVSDWLPVAAGAEKPFDAALMKIGSGFHVGIVVRRGLVLHMPLRGTSVIEPLSRFRTVLAAVEGVTGLYRHRELSGR
jgi:cell wall-associated NlpC family hydrolase